MVFIDANEDLSKGHLKSMFHRLGINDAIQQRVQLANKYRAYKNPATWFRGRRQIDGAFLSQGLQCSKARYLPFWAGIGDHRVMVLDIPHQILYGEEKLHIAKPLSRRLQCSQKKCLNKYIKYIFEDLLFKCSKILARRRNMASFK